MTARLLNPVNDAKDMAYTLKKLGFKVTLKTNANQRTMERAIRDFGKQLRKGGVGLFYFAGHGIQVKGSNYLIPIGAVLESEGDAKYEAVDAGLVLAKMEDAGNGFNIVILDACRNNPFSRSFRSAETGLAKMDAPSGSILAYATAPGSIAADGTGRNGLYTAKLLKHMVTPNLKIEEVFKRVRIDVASDSGNKQTPWESSSLMGDFYFNSGRSISVVKRQPSDDQPTLETTQLKKHSQKSGEIQFESRELRYAKSLYERGKKAEAKRIVSGQLQQDDDSILAEAMYSQIIWGFADNDRETFEKLKAYYPDFKWIAIAEKTITEREKALKKQAEKEQEKTVGVTGIEILDYGIYMAEEIKSEENEGSATGKRTVVKDIKFISRTNSIQAKIGDRFGISFVMRGQPEGKKVAIKTISTYPDPGIPNPKTGIYKRKSTFSRQLAIGKKELIGYGFDRDSELVPGEWTFQIWYDGKKWAEKTFNVYLP